MAANHHRVEITGDPALLRLAEEVDRSRRTQVLARGRTELAIVSPLPPKQAVPTRRTRGVLTPDDSLWDIVGIGQSDGPGDVSAHKQQYLTEAPASTT